MTRLLATAVGAETGQLVTIDLAHIDHEVAEVADLSTAIYRSRGAAKWLFRQVWWADDDGRVVEVLKDNIGGLRPWKEPMTSDRAAETLKADGQWFMARWLSDSGPVSVRGPIAHIDGLHFVLLVEGEPYAVRWDKLLELKSVTP